MRHFRNIAVLLSLLFVSGAAIARNAELVNPAPVAVPAGITQEQAVKDIKRALAGRGWVVALEQPGHIESMLNLREHVARIDIKYDARDVVVTYLDSRNLDYKMKNGKASIHRNYLSWIDNITRDIATNMQLSVAEQ